jgi:hypothetical protein
MEFAWYHYLRCCTPLVPAFSLFCSHSYGVVLPLPHILRLRFFCSVRVVMFCSCSSSLRSVLSSGGGMRVGGVLKRAWVNGTANGHAGAYRAFGICSHYWWSILYLFCHSVLPAVRVPAFLLQYRSVATVLECVPLPLRRSCSQITVTCLPACHIHTCHRMIFGCVLPHITACLICSGYLTQSPPALFTI